ARSAHNRHPPTRSQSAHRPRSHDRSPPEPFPVSFVPFDIRPEHPLAPTETACSSNSREETTATPVRPALRLAPASAILGVWQFAVLPSADAYCGATPTECVPFLGIAVSSITSTASLPPTSLSAWTSSSVSTGVASQTPAAMK